jgi:nucleoside-diphosphate-sugar epimerase
MATAGLSSRVENGGNVSVLVTGGAGFIGSNLVRHLVASGEQVRVLDDLSTGSAANLHGIEDKAELVVDDVRDPAAVWSAMMGVDVVYHLAALPTVARSVADPIAVNSVNVDGTLNVLVASRDADVRRVVYASSSSVYGDTPTLPKYEDMPAAPQSPYAASKLAGEVYCRAFSAVYGLETVSLRFFNVFGPGQDPDSEYAAVIPRFIRRILVEEAPVIFGDGGQSRDFTYVDNAVRACVLAASAGPESAGEAMNVACGARITLLELVEMLNEALGTRFEPQFAPVRPGDVRHSLAAVGKAERLIGYVPTIPVRDGLSKTAKSFAGEISRLPAPAGRATLEE